MPLQLAANISWMFTEAEDVVQRFGAAKGAGFTAVEGGPIYDVDPAALAAAREAAGVQHVLINGHLGNREGDKGLGAVAGREQDFRDSLDISIKYAKALQCPRIHILSGTHPKYWADEAMGEVLVTNLKYAADRLASEGIIGVLESIHPRVVPNYFLDTPEKVFSCIQKVNHPNIKMLLDIYHLQLCSGNLTANIEKYLPYSAHIQVSQAPDRNELDHTGEIDYQYILNQLDKSDYTGWIGLEYAPSSGNTVESLNWMKKWGYQ